MSEDSLTFVQTVRVPLPAHTSPLLGTRSAIGQKCLAVALAPGRTLADVCSTVPENHYFKYEKYFKKYLNKYEKYFKISNTISNVVKSLKQAVCKNKS